MNNQPEEKVPAQPANPSLSDTMPSTDAYAEPGAVLVIPRVALNYVVIAIVFFGLGLLIGGAAVNALFNANSSENQALVDSAVASALDARGVQADQVVGLQPGQRYDVTADDDPVLGDVNAPITIVEFSDFRCQYCRRFYAETLQPLMTEYDGKVKLVFRDFPILGPESQISALAAGCMNEQGRFWDFHNTAFANPQSLNRDTFISYAQDFGIDAERFTSCLDGQEYGEEITKDYTEAQLLGVTGTPAFFINGVFVSGAQPYAVFASVIDQELAKLQESAPQDESSTG